MAKAAGSSLSNGQAFYNFLHREGIPDRVIEGRDSTEPAGKSAKGTKEKAVPTQAVFAYVFNHWAKYSGKLQEHFKKLGLDLTQLKEAGEGLSGAALQKKISELARAEADHLQTRAEQASKAGDPAQANQFLTQAQRLYRTTVEFDPSDSTANRKLAEGLLADKNFKEARFYLCQAVRYAADLSELDGLQKIFTDPAHKKLLHRKENTWELMGQILVHGERYPLAAGAFERAARGTEEPALKKYFSEKREWVLEAAEEKAGNPYLLDFAETNPIAVQFYGALRALGIPNKNLESTGRGTADRRLTAAEVFDFIGENLADSRVQTVLQSAGIQLQRGDEIDISERGFGYFMAEKFNRQAQELKQKDGKKNFSAIAEHLQRALYFDPGVSSRYQALGDFFGEHLRYAEAMHFYAAAVELDPKDVSLKHKLKESHRKGVADGMKRANEFEAKGKLKESAEALQQVHLLHQTHAEIFYKDKPNTQENLWEMGLVAKRLGGISQSLEEKDAAKKFHQEAVKYFDEALKAKLTHPEVIQIYLDKAESQHALGDYLGALQSRRIAANCHKMAVQLGPNETFNFNYAQLRGAKNEGHDYTNGREVLGAAGTIQGNYVPSEAHQIDLNNPADQIPPWADHAAGVAKYRGQLEERLTELTKEREAAEIGPPDLSKLITLIAEEISLHQTLGLEASGAYTDAYDEAVGHDQKVTDLSKKLTGYRQQSKIEQQTRTVQLLTEKGYLHDVAMMQDDHRAGRGTPRQPALSHFVTLQIKNRQRQLIFTENFQALDEAAQLRLLDALVKVGRREEIVQQTGQSDGPSKPFYEAQLALLDGDKKLAERKLNELKNNTKDGWDPQLHEMVAELSEVVGASRDQGDPTPREVATELKGLLGPLMTSLYQGKDGALDWANLSRDEIKTFDDFQNFLAAQASIDAGTTVPLLFSAYNEVLAKPEYKPLLEVLYSEYSGDKNFTPSLSGPELRDRLHALTRDIAEVSFSKFAQRNLTSKDGPKRLRSILQDSVHYDVNFRADLLEEMMEAADKQGYCPDGLWLAFNKQIDTWMPDMVSDQEIRNGTRIGLRVLEIVEQAEAEKSGHKTKYSEHPEEIAVLRTKGMRQEITPARIREMAELYEKNIGKHDHAPAMMEAKLAHLWLMVADNSNWTKTTERIDEEVRAFLLNNVEQLIDESKNLTTDAEFLAFNERVGDFLAGTASPDGSKRWNQAKAVLGVDDVAGVFSALPSHVVDGYSGLNKSVAEYVARADMGQPIPMGPADLQFEDEKVKEKVQALIQGLEGVRGNICYQYKQKSWAARGAARFSDTLPKIDGAHQKIDELISALQGAKTKDDLQAVQAMLTQTMKDGGALHQGLSVVDPSLMDQVWDLGKVMAEILAVAVITRGVGVAATVARSTRAAYQILRAQRVVAAGQRAQQGFRALSSARTVVSDTTRAVRMARAATTSGERMSVLEQGLTARLKTIEKTKGLTAAAKARRSKAAWQGFAKAAGKEEAIWLESLSQMERHQVKLLETRLKKQVARWDTMSKAERMVHMQKEAFKIGFKINPTGEFTAWASDQVQERKFTVMAMLKDSLATAFGMAVAAPLAPGALSIEGLNSGVMGGLFRRFTMGGFKGMKHIGGDIGAEVLEEVLQNYVNKFLGGDRHAMSLEEFRDITLMCGMGGGSKMRTVVQIIRGEISPELRQELEAAPTTPIEETKPEPVGPTTREWISSQMPAGALKSVTNLGIGLGTLLGSERAYAASNLEAHSDNIVSGGAITTGLLAIGASAAGMYLLFPYIQNAYLSISEKKFQRSLHEAEEYFVKEISHKEDHLLQLMGKEERRRIGVFDGTLGTFDATVIAFETLKATGWKDDQQYQFLLEYLNKIGEPYEDALYVLPSAFHRFTGSDESFEQKSQEIIRFLVQWKGDLEFPDTTFLQEAKRIRCLAWEWFEKSPSLPIFLRQLEFAENPEEVNDGWASTLQETTEKETANQDLQAADDPVLRDYHFEVGSGAKSDGYLIYNQFASTREKQGEHFRVINWDPKGKKLWVAPIDGGEIRPLTGIGLDRNNEPAFQSGDEVVLVRTVRGEGAAGEKAVAGERRKIPSNEPPSPVQQVLRGIGQHYQAGVTIDEAQETSPELSTEKPWEVLRSRAEMHRGEAEHLIKIGHTPEAHPFLKWHMERAETLKQEADRLEREALTQLSFPFLIGEGQGPGVIVPSPNPTPTWRVKDISPDRKTLVLENVADPSVTTTAIALKEHHLNVGDGVETAGAGGGSAFEKKTAEPVSPSIPPGGLRPSGIQQKQIPDLKKMGRAADAGNLEAQKQFQQVVFDHVPEAIAFVTEQAQGKATWAIECLGRGAVVHRDLQAVHLEILKDYDFEARSPEATQRAGYLVFERFASEGEYRGEHLRVVNWDPEGKKLWVVSDSTGEIRPLVGYGLDNGRRPAFQPGDRLVLVKTVLGEGAAGKKVVAGKRKEGPPSEPPQRSEVKTIPPAAEPSSPRNLEGKYWKVTRTEIDPTTGEVRHYSVPKTAGSASTADLGEGDLRLICRYYPDLARTLGIREEADGSVSYPDMAGLNRRLEAGGFGFRFYEPAEEDYKAGTEEVKEEIYLEHLTKEIPEFPLANKGKYHFHDFVFHILGLVAMPPELMAKAQQSARFWLAFQNDKVFQNARKEIKNLIGVPGRELVEYFDTLTAALSIRLGHSYDIGKGRGLSSPATQLCASATPNHQLALIEETERKIQALHRKEDRAVLARLAEIKEEMNNFLSVYSPTDEEFVLDPTNKEIFLLNLLKLWKNARAALTLKPPPIDAIEAEYRRLKEDSATRFASWNTDTLQSKVKSLTARGGSAEALPMLFELDRRTEVDSIKSQEGIAMRLRALREELEAALTKKDETSKVSAFRIRNKIEVLQKLLEELHLEEPEVPVEVKASQPVEQFPPRGPSQPVQIGRTISGILQGIRPPEFDTIPPSQKETLPPPAPESLPASQRETLPAPAPNSEAETLRPPPLEPLSSKPPSGFTFLIGAGKGLGVIVPSDSPNPTWRIKRISPDRKYLILEKPGDPSVTTTAVALKEHTFVEGDGVETGGAGGGRALAEMEPISGSYYEARREIREDGSVWITAWPKKDGTALGFEGNLAKIANRFPELAEKLGITLNPDGSVTYPNVHGLNQRLEAHGFQFRFWEPTEKEVKGGPQQAEAGQAQIFYTLEHLAKFPPEFPLSAWGTEHFHDLGIHLLGYAAMPPEILTEISQTAKMLLEWIYYPEFRKEGPAYEALWRVIETFIDGGIDLNSGLLSENIEKIREKRPSAEDLEVMLTPLGIISELCDPHRIFSQFSSWLQEEINAYPEENAEGRALKSAMKRAERILEGLPLPSTQILSPKNFPSLLTQVQNQIGSLTDDTPEARSGIFNFLIGLGEALGVVVPSKGPAPTWHIQSISSDRKTLVLENAKNPAITTIARALKKHFFKVGDPVETAGGGGGKALTELERKNTIDEKISLAQKLAEQGKVSEAETFLFEAAHLAQEIENPSERVNLRIQIAEHMAKLGLMNEVLGMLSMEFSRAGRSEDSAFITLVQPNIIRSLVKISDPQNTELIERIAALAKSAHPFARPSCLRILAERRRDSWKPMEARKGVLVSKKGKLSVAVPPPTRIKTLYERFGTDLGRMAALAQALLDRHFAGLMELTPAQLRDADTVVNLEPDDTLPPDIDFLDCLDDYIFNVKEVGNPPGVGPVFEMMFHPPPRDGKIPPHKGRRFYYEVTKVDPNTDEITLRDSEGKTRTVVGSIPGMSHPFQAEPGEQVVLFYPFEGASGTRPGHSIPLQWRDAQDNVIPARIGRDLISQHDPNHQRYSPGISADHAQLEWTSEGFMLSDVGSSNGTFVYENRDWREVERGRRGAPGEFGKPVKLEFDDTGRSQLFRLGDGYFVFNRNDWQLYAIPAPAESIPSPIPPAPDQTSWFTPPFNNLGSLSPREVQAMAQQHGLAPLFKSVDYRLLEVVQKLREYRPNPSDPNADLYFRGMLQAMHLRYGINVQALIEMDEGKREPLKLFPIKGDKGVKAIHHGMPVTVEVGGVCFSIKVMNVERNIATEGLHASVQSTRPDPDKPYHYIVELLVSKELFVGPPEAQPANLAPVTRLHVSLPLTEVMVHLGIPIREDGSLDNTRIVPGLKVTQIVPFEIERLQGSKPAPPPVTPPAPLEGKPTGTPPRGMAAVGAEASIRGPVLRDAEGKELPREQRSDGSYVLGGYLLFRQRSDGSWIFMDTRDPRPIRAGEKKLEFLKKGVALQFRPEERKIYFKGDFVEPGTERVLEPGDDIIAPEGMFRFEVLTSTDFDHEFFNLRTGEQQRVLTAIYGTKIISELITALRGLTILTSHADAAAAVEACMRGEKNTDRLPEAIRPKVLELMGEHARKARINLPPGPPLTLARHSPFLNSPPQERAFHVVMEGIYLPQRIKTAQSVEDIRKILSTSHINVESLLRDLEAWTLGQKITREVSNEFGLRDRLEKFSTPDSAIDSRAVAALKGLDQLKEEVRTQILAKAGWRGKVKGVGGKSFAVDDLEEILHNFLERTEPLAHITRAQGIRELAYRYMDQVIAESRKLYPAEWSRARAEHRNYFTGESLGKEAELGDRDKQFRLARMLLYSKAGRPIFGEPTASDVSTLTGFVGEFLGEEGSKRYEAAQEEIRYHFTHFTDKLKRALLWLKENPQDDTSIKAFKKKTMALMIEAFFGKAQHRPMDDPDTASRLVRFIGKCGFYRELSVTHDFYTQPPSAFLSLGDLGSVSVEKHHHDVEGHTHPEEHENEKGQLQGMEYGSKGIQATFAHGFGERSKDTRNVLFSTQDIIRYTQMAQHWFRDSRPGNDPSRVFNKETRVYWNWVQHAYGLAEIAVQLDAYGRPISATIRYGVYEKERGLDKNHERVRRKIEQMVNNPGVGIPIRVINVKEEGSTAESLEADIDRGAPWRR